MKRVHLQIRMDVELRQWLRAVAFQNGMTTSEWCRNVLQASCDREHRKGAKLEFNEPLPTAGESVEILNAQAQEKADAREELQRRLAEPVVEEEEII